LYDVDGMSHYYQTKGRTSLPFQTFMRVVEVLSMEKAKRFLCYDCGGPSATLQR